MEALELIVRIAIPLMVTLCVAWLGRRSAAGRRKAVAQLIATAQKETGHYYLPTGEPCHGDLRQARKQKAYPRPTTIMGAVLARPGLDNWKQANVS